MHRWSGPYLPATRGDFSTRTKRPKMVRLALVYFHKLSEFHSYQLVYVDESGCDKQIGFRRTGWSPLGVAPIQVAKFHRGQCYQILPAYAQDSILLSHVLTGLTDAIIFEDFIGQLLQHRGRWPEPKSVLIMDNALFHHSERIKEMCSEAGVKLLYLPLYSPDLNPIEEFFSELQSHIKQDWEFYETGPDQGFELVCKHALMLLV